MNESSKAFDALALIPGWDPGEAEIEELKGGLTNSTYRVRYDEEDYALRLDVEESEVLRFDRTYELSIMNAAHEAGIGPEVVHVDSEAGMMLTRFLPGRVWEDKDLESDEQLGRLAATLRAVHALPACGKRVDYVEEASRYEVFLERRQGLHAFASRCVEIVRKSQDRGVEACCHNDIIMRTVIDNGELRLIDWEYARDNDPLYDLAGAIGFHDLDERRATVLLDAYAGGANAELQERLDEQCRVYDAIQWLWFATRQIVYPDPEQVKRLEALQQRIS
jgi:thiamine kinase-like enzyme